MASADPVVSLTAASAAGPGVTADFATAKQVVTMVVVPSLKLTGGVVLMEASHDNTNWVVLRTIDMTERDNFSVSSSGVAFRYWRANVARTPGGGTVRATFMEAG